MPAECAPWGETRRDSQLGTQHKNSLQDIADLERGEASNAGDLKVLRVASGNLACTSTSALNLDNAVEPLYGGAIWELEAFKKKAEFIARYRDYMADFEDDVFDEFSFSDVPAARRLKTKAAVLSVLSKLLRMARRTDEQSRRFVTDNEPVKQAWYAAVEAVGLSLEHYETLRAFNWHGGADIHNPAPACESLKVLESMVSMPEGLQHLREPLIALLKHAR